MDGATEAPIGGAQVTERPEARVRGGEAVAGDGPIRDRPAREALVQAALLVLCGLLFLTACFGRAFSKVGWEAHSVYVTEAALAAVLVLAFAGLGPGRFVARIRDRVPVIPLGIFWLAGAVAAARGWRDFGLTQTLHDIGLVEYSVLILAIAVAASTVRDAHTIIKALAAGGIVAIAFFLLATAFGSDLPPWKWATIGTAGTAVYISLFVCWFAARVLHRERVPVWEWAVAWLGIALIALTYSRAAWIAAFAALAVLVALAPRTRRLTALAIGGALLVTAGGAAIGAEKLKISGDAADLRAQAEALEAQSLQEQKAPESNAPAKPKGDVEIPQAVRETFSNNLSEGSNAKWRLAIWKYDVKEAAKAPVFGVGYGKPTDFHWGGHVYDGRTGNGQSEDVSGPHNSFVNILFRMGVVGIGALIALLVVAGRRAWPWIRQTGVPSRERTTLVALIAMLVFASVVAALNVALEGPFIGIFFWAVLGLLLILPKLYGTPTPAPQPTDPR